jgi:NDP-sugar pyrophosphorylase family protein
MQIVIPMAGRGGRFQRAGYDTLKPLIEVEGRPIIEHVVGLFPGERDFLFICADDQLAGTPLRAILERVAPAGRIVGIPAHKLGPVHTALAAADHIADDQPVILNYCDFAVGWDYADFRRELAERDPAGALTAYRGFHPHSLGPNLYAYLRERDHYLVAIKEKDAFTDDRLSEFASSGTYYFRSGALLKHYFRQAVARDLRTNGEYYASTPYNLLVADNLPVYIYELRHFVQWGTPEDLEEYWNWSDYFARFANWRPSLPPAPGAVLAPMAGAGERFAAEGFVGPKPLVPVAGRPMVARALETIPPARRWVAVCQAQHLHQPELAQTLNGAGREVDIVPVTGLTAGQASTCLLAREWVDPDAPLFIAPCDTAFVYDETRWTALTSDPEVDCAVWVFRNHPHANRNPQHYGWVRATRAGEVTGVAVKATLDPSGQADVRGDPGITGAFWFRQARFFFEAAEALIAQDRRVNGEFYVDSAIGVLVEQGRCARVFDVQHYICFGTPDDVRTYEYWSDYFHLAQHHPFSKNGHHAAGHG